MKSEPKVEMLDVEPDVIPQKSISNQAAASTDTVASKEETSKKEEVIDLTISDSDDEPLMAKKKQMPDSSNHVIKSSGKSVTLPFVFVSFH